jgi:hypothetical protein
MAAKQRVHRVVLRLTFNRAITAGAAVRAARGEFPGAVLYAPNWLPDEGDGWDEARVTGAGRRTVDREGR